MLFTMTCRPLNWMCCFKFGVAKPRKATELLEQIITFVASCVRHPIIGIDVQVDEHKIYTTFISRVTDFNHLANMFTTTIGLSFLTPDKSYSTSLQVYSSKACSVPRECKQKEIWGPAYNRRYGDRTTVHQKPCSVAEHKVLIMSSSSWFGVFGIRGVCKDERGDNWRWFIWNTMSLLFLCGFEYLQWCAAWHSDETSTSWKLEAAIAMVTCFLSLLVMQLVGERWCHNMVPVALLYLYGKKW